MFFGIILLLTQRIFIIKYLENTRKYDQGIMTNHSPALTYLHEHIARFHSFFLQNTSYVSTTSISLIFSGSTQASSFQLPYTKFFSTFWSLHTHPLSPESSVPTAWLPLHPPCSSLKIMSSERSSLTILSQESFALFLIFFSYPS